MFTVGMLAEGLSHHPPLSSLCGCLAVALSQSSLFCLQTSVYSLVSRNKACLCLQKRLFIFHFLISYVILICLQIRRHRGELRKLQPQINVVITKIFSYQSTVISHIYDNKFTLLVKNELLCCGLDCN